MFSPLFCSQLDNYVLKAVELEDVLVARRHRSMRSSSHQVEWYDRPQRVRETHRETEELPMGRNQTDTTKQQEMHDKLYTERQKREREKRDWEKEQTLTLLSGHFRDRPSSPVRDSNRSTHTLSTSGRFMQKVRHRTRK